LRGFVTGNGFPTTIFDSVVKKLLDQKYDQQISSNAPTPSKFYFSSPYFGPQSEKLHIDLQKLLEKYVPN
jgi:hypothetical protein